MPFYACCNTNRISLGIHLTTHRNHKQQANQQLHTRYPRNNKELACCSFCWFDSSCYHGSMIGWKQPQGRVITQTWRGLYHDCIDWLESLLICGIRVHYPHDTTPILPPPARQNQSSPSFPIYGNSLSFSSQRS